jgi:hypothetical protein
LGEGMIKILSDQGSIMEWTVLYTPLSSGTVLSPDNYHSTHKLKYYAFYHMGTSESTGRMGFLDYNHREVESIQMKRTHNGEWLTTNQVLVVLFSRDSLIFMGLNGLNIRSCPKLK